MVLLKLRNSHSLFSQTRFLPDQQVRSACAQVLTLCAHRNSQRDLASHLSIGRSVHIRYTKVNGTKVETGVFMTLKPDHLCPNEMADACARVKVESVFRTKESLALKVHLVFAKVNNP